MNTPYASNVPTRGHVSKEGFLEELPLVDH